MNTTLLIFFAIPLAVIIVSIALQKILKCPPLVAGIIFAVGIIITAIIGNLNILAATLAYTLISYITTLIICFITRFNNNNNDNRYNNNSNDLLTTSSHCQNNGNLLEINNSSDNGNENKFNQVNTINGVIRVIDTNGNNNLTQDEINTRINIVPNSSNNGRTGSICGRYRRR